jgi:uncharacterized OB-fold protein
LPVINEDSAPFWDYCRRHELRMQQCKSCGYIRFPASVVCPKCHSLEAEWVKLSGRGKVWSFIVYRQVYHPAFKDDIPYAVAIIELDEGPRLESNVIGCKMEDIHIDMPVDVTFEDANDEITLPKFKPAA